MNYPRVLRIISLVVASFAGLMIAPTASAIEAFPDSLYPKIFGFNIDDLDDCQAAGSESTISCNQSGFPALLMSKASRPNLWGNGGKGTVFATDDGLIEGDQQLRTAKAGDVLHFSTAIDSERYYDEEETKPIREYVVSIIYSVGLIADENNMTVKVGDAVLDSSSYQITTTDASESLVSNQGVIVEIKIPWINRDSSRAFESFKYDDGATIEIVHSAVIGDDAVGEVSSGGSYQTNYLNGTSEAYDSTSNTDVASEKYWARALIDGNLVIRRVDAGGKPVAGARYTIAGVSAKKGIYGNELLFDDEGSITEFTTDDDGMIVVRYVPLGEYEVTELSSPDGQAPEQVQKTVEVSWDNSAFVSYEVKKYRMMGSDVTPVLVDLGHNLIAMSSGGMGDEANYYYDEESGSYKASKDDALIGEMNISYDEQNDKYVLSFGNNEKSYDLKYDEETGKYLALVYASDNIEEDKKEEYYSQNLLIFNDDGTITIATSPDNPMLFGNRNEKGCYGYIGEQSAEELGGTAVLCEEPSDGGYTMAVLDEVSVASSGFAGMATHFVHNEEHDSWVYDYVAICVSLTKLDDGGYRIGYYVPFTHFDSVDRYYLAFPPLYIQLDFGLTGGMEEQRIFAASALFRPLVSDVVPENVPNPQTDDGEIIMSLVLLAGVGLSVAAVKRRFIRR